MYNVERTMVNIPNWKELTTIGGHDLVDIGWKNYGKYTKLKGTHNINYHAKYNHFVERTMVNIPNWKELTTLKLYLSPAYLLKELW